MQYVRAVADAGLDFFEQPVSADDLAGMAAVAAAAARSRSAPTRASIRLDDIRRHHEHGAARGVSLKAIKLGGMRGVAAAGPAVRPARPQRQRLGQDRRIQHRLRGGHPHRRRAAADRLGADADQRGPRRRRDRATHPHRARTRGGLRSSGARHRRRRGQACAAIAATFRCGKWRNADCLRGAMGRE